jgi:hypothetical protein
MNAKEVINLISEMELDHLRSLEKGYKPCKQTSNSLIESFSALDQGVDNIFELLDEWEDVERCDLLEAALHLRNTISNLSVLIGLPPTMHWGDAD